MLDRIFPVLTTLLIAAIQPVTAFAAQPDKQAPTVPTNLVAASVTTTGFTASWTRATDNVGVTAYEVFLNAVSQGTVTTTSKVFTGLVPGTACSVTVRARDAAGNWSAQSQPLSVTTAADTVAPTTPANLVASSVSTSGFTVTWTAATDNVGVTGYEVFLGGSSQGVVTTTSKVFTGLSAGTTYSVTVRGRDAAGNWSAQSSPVSVTTQTDFSAPTVPTNLVSSGVSATGFTVTWTASTDNVGVTGYEVFLNGVSQGTAAALSKAFAGLLPATTYSVSVRARDAASNWSPTSSPLSVSTLSDSVAPTTPTALASSGVTSSGFTVTWSASTDNVGVTGYEVFLGGVSQGVVATTAKDFAGLQPSTTYSATIRARDAAGNWSPQSSPLGVTTSAAPAITYVISAGESDVAVAKSDGTVWAWGRYSAAPVRVGAITTARSVATGGSHLLILQTDGTVLGYGDSGYGQLADGTTTSPISRFTGVAAVAAGWKHSLALKADGTLYGWGYNYNGQVGNGKTTLVTSPTKLNQISGISKIATGYNHNLALKSDGTVLAWGGNAHGEVGNGATTDQLSPTVVTGFSGVVAIAAGGMHSLALKSDGTVWAWGDNSSGQLGNGTLVNSQRPVQVTGLTGITSISAGLRHSIAQKADGSIWAWGANSYRQLGDGTCVARSTPVRTTIVSTAAKVVAGGFATFAVLADGTIRAWGSPQNGALGDGGTVTRNLPFDDVIQMTRWSMADIAILRRGGTVWTWGQNQFGDLGDGSIEPSADAKQIQGLTGVVKIDRGIALRDDGTVWTWGPNDKGQLGNGTVANRLTAGAVPGLSGVTMIASGTAHHAVLRSDGTVWTWGDNAQGALGDGTSIQRNTPVQVPDLYNVVRVFAGGPNTYAVKTDGTLWSWGGDWWTTTVNTNQIEFSPKRAPLTGVVSISYGGEQALFLMASVEVYTCGFEDLGVGPWWGSADPLLLPNMHNVVEVSSTVTGTITRAADGTIWRWDRTRSSSDQIQVVAGVVDPLGIKSVTGAGIIYQSGKVVLWNAPSLRPAGLVDLAMQVADLRVAVSAADADSDGLPDAWEMQQFGNLSHAAAGDDDNDGVTNVQEYLRLSNPTKADADQDGFLDSADFAPDDSYNGVPPNVTIVGGNNQRTQVDQYNANPFDVAVWRADGSGPMVGSPVTFSVAAGGGLLAKDNSGSAILGSSLARTTDVDGSVQVYYKQPSAAGVQSQIIATAGLSQVVFSTSSALAGDSDGDGLVDSWEQRYLGTLTFNGSDDPGSVGRTLLQSQQQDLSPWPSADVPAGLRAWYSANLGVAYDGLGNVSHWTDLSGRGVHVAQTTISAQPTRISNGPGGKPAVRFSGIQSLLSGAATDLQAGSSDLTVIAVLLPATGQTAAAEVFTYGGSEYAGEGLIAESATRFNLRWYDGSGGEQRSPSANLTSGQTQLVTAIKNGSSTAILRNGVTLGTAAVPAAAAPIIAKLALGHGLSGQLAELLVYNRALTTAEREQVEGILAARYSVPVGSIPDADGDGLSDAEEDLLGTNKTQADHPDVQLVVIQPTKRAPTP